MGHHLSPAWITVGQRNEWSCLMKVCFLIWYPDITRFPCPYTELAQRNPPSSNQSITNDSDLEGSDSNMETSETEQDQSDNDEDKGEDNKLLWNPPVTYWAFNEARFHYAVRHINFMYFWIESRAWGRVAIFLVGLIPEACSSNGGGCPLDTLWRVFTISTSYWPPHAEPKATIWPWRPKFNTKNKKNNCGFYMIYSK